MKRQTMYHLKMRKLSWLLDIPLTQAIGIVALLFDFRDQYAPDGNLADFEDDAIAAHLEWVDKGPLDLMVAMIDSGWLTDDKENQTLILDAEEVSTK